MSSFFNVCSSRTQHSQQTIEQEFNDLNLRQEWSTLFELLETKSRKHSFTMLESQKPANKLLNRYTNVCPYDHTRIVLESAVNTDYINANLITVSCLNRRYIFTQGPLDTTVAHFWLMVWEQQCKLVIMLNQLVERGVEKCYKYWPEVDMRICLNEVGLEVHGIEKEMFESHCYRLFKITNTSNEESRQVMQYQYLGWKDFDVPSSPKELLGFREKVKESAVFLEDQPPPVVHCSAGIGRSGTFALIDCGILFLEKFEMGNPDLKAILLEMRQCRAGVIQTAEQLQFAYQSVLEGLNQMRMGSTQFAHFSTLSPSQVSQFSRSSNISHYSGYTSQRSLAPVKSLISKKGSTTSKKK